MYVRRNKPSVPYLALVLGASYLPDVKVTLAETAGGKEGAGGVELTT